MFDFNSHAKDSNTVRQASANALGLSQNLLKLNAGPVFDYEWQKLIEEMKQQYNTIAKLMGTEVVNENRTYNIGERTMRQVFEFNGLTNVSDMQAVFDAMESTLLRLDIAKDLVRRD